MCGALILWVPFPPFFGFVHILVAINCASKWIEALATRTNHSKVAVKLVKEYIFFQYGTLKAIISY